jgi:hypothetical protein
MSRPAPSLSWGQLARSYGPIVESVSLPSAPVIRLRVPEQFQIPECETVQTGNRRSRGIDMSAHRHSAKAC